jgi:hypothetical protein
MAPHVLVEDVTLKGIRDALELARAAICSSDSAATTPTRARSSRPGTRSG